MAKPFIHPGLLNYPEVPPLPDWDELRRQAEEIRQHAYAPYSRFSVGAAGLVGDGRIVTGANVENACYGVGLCAECGMVSQLVATGGGRLIAVSCSSPHGIVLPCGRCRQLLWEFGGAQCLVDTPDGPLPLVELLPQAFGPDDLEKADQIRSSENDPGPQALDN